jgi:hypothetical protein
MELDVPSCIQLPRRRMRGSKDSWNEVSASLLDTRGGAYFSRMRGFSELSVKPHIRELYRYTIENIKQFLWGVAGIL